MPLAPWRRRGRAWRRRTRPPGSVATASTSACSPALSRPSRRRAAASSSACVSTRRVLPIWATLSTPGCSSNTLLRAPRLSAHAPRACGRPAPVSSCGRAVGDQHAAVEDGEAMAALGLVHVVRRHQDRGAGIGQLEQLFPEVAARFRIDRAGRLVEEQQLGLVDHRAGQRQALLLAAAHRAGQLLLPILEVVVLEQFVDARAASRLGDVLHRGEEFQVLAHAQVLEQRELLRHVADAAAQCLGLLRDAQAQHFDLAFGRRQQAAQHADGGGLARAVRAEEAVDVRARHGQVDVVDRDQRAEALGQPARADGESRGVGHRPLFARTRPAPASPPASRAAVPVQLDFGQIAQARRVLADQRVVRSEAGLAADHPHPARQRRVAAVDEDARALRRPSRRRGSARARRRARTAHRPPA